jgi:hypothetical protein
MCVDTFEPNETFTQGHFIGIALSDLRKRAENLRSRKHSTELVARPDNSCCHNGQKGVDKMRRNRVTRLGHGPYSFDLSPFDFW